MKILIIGSGGREHAIVWKLSQSKKVKRIYCAPGNPGIGEFAENVSISLSDTQGLIDFVKKNDINLTFVGPEVPLIDGIVDSFRKNNLTIVGPTKKAAQVEGSKAFAKNLMKKYNIPTAKYRVFNNLQKAKRYLESQPSPIVIKASGQAAGKGVLVAKNKKEAMSFLRSIMVDKVFGPSGDTVVIEEYLEGQEVSFMVATDGKDFVSFVPSQDHKRVFDEDLGPNTGGMGAYAPVPFVDTNLIKRIENEIVKPTLLALQKEGSPYQGILYPGVILTKTGPKVLEFNCRFGDPETQPLLSLLATDLVEIFIAIVKKQVRNLVLRWHKGFAVCVILTAKGYPGKYDKGKVISLARSHLANVVTVFHSGTKISKGQLVSSGGRVLGVTAVDKTLVKALKKTYSAIGTKGIFFSGMHFRKDIAKKGLIKDQPEGPLSYKKAGINYAQWDFVKKKAQESGRETSMSLTKISMKELSKSRGESAYVVETKDSYLAFVQEGLGTKNIVADEMRKITGKSYYDSIAKDAIAAILNDLVTVGATPISLMAYWAIGKSDWFNNKERTRDLIEGWKRACIESNVSWGGGETPTLSGIIQPERIDLAGSATGIVEPKSRLITGKNVVAGDSIIFLESSGVHANGITLLRRLAESLEKGYATKLPSGKMFGEEILTPTRLYVRLIQKLLSEKIPLHYIVHISGHGWRKLMRLEKSFQYQITDCGIPQEIFEFIQKSGKIRLQEMYATFNMGAGFALFIDPKDSKSVVQIAKKTGIRAWIGGSIEKGEKQINIQPLSISFQKKDLDIR